MQENSYICNEKYTDIMQYTDNEKSKISTNLNTVSIILLHSAIIVLCILSIGATVNCYLLLPL